jgi:polysaccharide biosynthesis protein PslH
MKRILWLSHILPYPLESGVILRSYNLIKELSKQHEITLLAFNQKDNCPTQNHIDQAIAELSKYCKVAGVVDIPSEKSKAARLSLVAKGFMPNQTYTNLWLTSSEFELSLSRLLTEESYDLIHYDTISLAQYWRPIAGAKSSLNHHNIESLMMLRRSENERNLAKKIYTWFEGVKLKTYEARACKNFDVNLTCSELDVERLNEITSVDRCVSIPNGVDTEFFKPEPGPKIPCSMVFTGSLSWYPNRDSVHYFFKQVWPLVIDKEPKASITIIGKHPPQWLLELQRNDARVQLAGFVDDVRPYMNKAEVYICPIRDGGGTKLKMLNALAAGSCIVADPIACEGLDVKDGEHVLLAKDPEKFASAVLNAFENGDLRRQVGNNARELASRKYEFKKIGGELARLYSEL